MGERRARRGRTQVGDVLYVHGELLVGEAAKAVPVDVDDEGVKGCDQGIGADVKLFTANQVGVFNVALDNVCLGLVCVLAHGRGRAPLVGTARRRSPVDPAVGKALSPLADLAHLVDEKDAFALRPA